MSHYETVERARLPRGPHGLTREDELFDAKEDCFAAAFDVAVEIVEARLDAAVAAVRTTNFRDLVRISLEAYLEILASEPAAARALHVETLAAGSALVSLASACNRCSRRACALPTASA